jgi:5-methylcytosine-specific restriction endonuclease McrA
VSRRNKHQTRAFWRRVEARWCAYCARRATTLDHVEPLSAGGSPGNENCLAACFDCNARKANHPLLVFLALKRSS